MDIDPKSVEKLAREYAKALPAVVSESSGISEQLTLLEEEQLELLNDLPRLAGRVSRTTGYIRNLIFRSLNRLAALSGNQAYVPSVRTPATREPNVKNRLLNLQLDIFILADKLPDQYPALAEFLMLENRKTALLSTI